MVNLLTPVAQGTKIPPQKQESPHNTITTRIEQLPTLAPNVRVSVDIPHKKRGAKYVRSGKESLITLPCAR